MFDDSPHSGESRPMLVILVLTAAVGAGFLAVRPIFVSVLASWGEGDAARVPLLCGWVVSVLVLLPAMLGGAWISMLAVAGAFGGGAGRGRLAAFGLAALALGVYLAFGGSDLSRSDEQALAVYRMLGADDPALDALRRIARALAAAGPAFSVLILFGMGALACAPRGEGADRLRVRSADLRTLLYVASLAMVGGTIATLYRLQLQIDAPLFALVEGADGLPARALGDRLGIAHAVALTYGGLYTIFLVIGFLPAWLGLRGAIHRAAQGSTQKERRTWLEEHDLQPRLSSHALSMGAALAPFLAASLEGSFGAVLSAVGAG